jgi:predicted nucleic acid-binding protein
MNAEVFLDTNVLIYAACGAIEHPAKHKAAWKIVRAGEYVLSGQVLAEFYVNATKKDERKKLEPLEPDEAIVWIDRLAALPVVPIDHRIVLKAVSYAQRYMIGYWDAALIAAAEAGGCQTLYTEDLNDGQKYGSVTVINPFKAA